MNTAGWVPYLFDRARGVFRWLSRQLCFQFDPKRRY